MTARLKILKASLAKKQKRLAELFDNHFATVKEANGQPLNDKRNGYATLRKWEKQNDAIRNAKAEIEKTENAIEREEDKIIDVDYWYDLMPPYLKKLIDDGTLKQWRKHPRIMFVDGVDKARLVFNDETGICSHRYVNQVEDKEQYAKIRDVFNAINKEQKCLLQK